MYILLQWSLLPSLPSPHRSVIPDYGKGKGNVDVDSDEEDGGAPTAEAFNPQYESLPALRPSQPPSYKPTPSYLTDSKATVCCAMYTHTQTAPPHTHTHKTHTGSVLYVCVKIMHALKMHTCTLYKMKHPAKLT